MYVLVYMYVLFINESLMFYLIILINLSVEQQ